MFESLEKKGLYKNLDKINLESHHIKTHEKKIVEGFMLLVDLICFECLRTQRNVHDDIGVSTVGLKLIELGV